jgi:outer membrane receptor protein involved in Fe transport
MRSEGSFARSAGSCIRSIATRSSLPAAVALWLLALHCAQAQAQAQALTADASEAPSLESIVVTGSRISGADATSANPITVVSADDIEKTDATNLEQIFMKLPATDFTGGTTSNTDYGGAGQLQVGLKNLGPQRTLILVNGQRFINTDGLGTYTATDVNNIPVPMIDHVDVLRDGASSIYGADAIGGVINVVTKQNFQGAEFGAMYGETSYGDGGRHGFYALLGTNFDRGNITINLSEDHSDPIEQSARPWAATQNPNAGYNSYTGISSRVTGAIGNINGTNYYFPSGLASGVPSSQAYKLGNPVGGGVYTGGGLTPGDFAFGSGGVYYNFLQTQGLTSGYERRQASFLGHYELAPAVRGILEAFFTDRNSFESLSAEPLGNVPTPQFPNQLYSAALLPNGAVNPYNPTNLPNALALYGAQGINVPIKTRRFEDGPLDQTDSVQTYRLRAGLEGKLLDRFDWAAGYFYAVSDGADSVANQTNFYHLSQELGMNACGTQPGCSVANFFGYNTLTAAQASYLTFTNTDRSELTQSDAYGSISGPLVALPAGPLQGAVGFEYRRDGLTNTPDSVESDGDAAVYSLPTAGHYSTRSGYVELDVPILASLPWVKQLSAQLSSRYDDNSVFGHDFTWKTGLNYAVDDAVRVRGSISTGFRAPQLQELYGGLSENELPGVDPCASNGAFKGSAACLAAIRAAGGNPNNITPVNQLIVLQGGNPLLRPETARNYSLGTVLTPGWLPNFELSLDYYSVSVNNEIGQLDPARLLNTCYGDTPYVVSQASACALVGPRVQGTGDLGIISALNGNIDNESTDGLELESQYHLPGAALWLPGGGTIGLRGQFTYLLRDSVSALGTLIQQAGTWTSDFARPHVKGLVNVEYATRSWSADWSTRYYGNVRNQDPTSPCQYGTVPCGSNPYDFPGNYAPGVFYHDINIAYRYQGLTASFGVDNLLNQDPPFLFPANQSNAAGSAGYDFTGRFLYLRAKYKF